MRFMITLSEVKSCHIHSRINHFDQNVHIVARRAQSRYYFCSTLRLVHSGEDVTEFVFGTRFLAGTGGL